MLSVIMFNVISVNVVAPKNNWPCDINILTVTFNAASSKASPFVASNHFHNNLIYASGVWSIGQAPALLSNNKLGLNRLVVTNTIAYNTPALITIVKSIMVQGLYSQHFIFFFTYKQAQDATKVFVPGKSFKPRVMQHSLFGPLSQVTKNLQCCEYGPRSLQGPLLFHQLGLPGVARVIILN